MHQVEDTGYYRLVYSWTGVACLLVLSLVPIVGLFVATYMVLSLRHFLGTTAVVKANLLGVANPFQRMIGPLARLLNAGTSNDYIKISLRNTTTVDAYLGALSGADLESVRVRVTAARARLSQTQVSEMTEMTYTNAFAEYYYGLRDLCLDGKLGAVLGFGCMWSIVMSILITIAAA